MIGTGCQVVLPFCCQNSSAASPTPSPSSSEAVPDTTSLKSRRIALAGSTGRSRDGTVPTTLAPTVSDVVKFDPTSPRDVSGRPTPSRTPDAPPAIVRL